MAKSLRDLPADLTGKRALVRVDYNVPLDGGRVTDPTRIEASLPTLRWLLARDARPVLLSHLGRPGGAPNPDYSLAPVARLLAEAMDAEVKFVGPCDGSEALDASLALAPKEILLLENTRFVPGETANDLSLSERLAQLGDFYVSDAFGSLHRAHASTVGVVKFLRPAVAGLLVERELETLSALNDPARPFVVGFGGAKISDKMDLMNAFLGRADRILVGGAMANTFLRARGFDMGASLVEKDAVDLARSILERSGERILLPVDLTVTSDVGDPESEVRDVPIAAIPPGAAAVDIGPSTRTLFAGELSNCASFFWNGPMGLFEDPRFAGGTLALATAAAEITARGAFTVIGGGDSAAAVRQANLTDRVSHVSTGGGAALKYLSSGRLPGIDVLDASDV